jgi:hypothetical protein
MGLEPSSIFRTKTRTGVKVGGGGRVLKNLDPVPVPKNQDPNSSLVRIL